nr:hypothetical protein B0A51_08771 [Rachicladosporium sp. CCFEE 5018]
MARMFVKLTLLGLLATSALAHPDLEPRQTFANTTSPTFTFNKSQTRTSLNGAESGVTKQTETGLVDAVPTSSPEPSSVGSSAETKQTLISLVDATTTTSPGTSATFTHLKPSGVAETKESQGVLVPTTTAQEVTTSSPQGAAAQSSSTTATALEQVGNTSAPSPTTSVVVTTAPVTIPTIAATDLAGVIASLAGSAETTNVAPTNAIPTTAAATKAPETTPKPVLSFTFAPASDAVGSSVAGTTTPVAPIVVTIGSAVVSQNSQSQFVVGSETLTPGGAVTRGSTTISLASSATAIVVNGQTTALPTASPQAIASPPAIVLGSSTITRNSAAQLVVGSQTLSAGGPAIVASGTTISLAPSATAIVVNGATSQILYTHSVQPPAGPTIISIGSSIVTANSASQFVVGSQTLSAGGAAITQGGTTFSLATSATALMVNGHTSAIQSVAAAAPSPRAAVITVGSDTITANQASAFVIGSQTLSAGEAITISGTAISLATQGTAIVVNGQTTPIVVPAAAPITLGPGAAATPIASGAFVLPSDSNLQAGSAITIGGTTYSVPSTGSTLIVNGRVIAAPTPQSITLGSLMAAVTPTLIGSQTAYIVAGQTLTQGGNVVIASQTLSIVSGGAAIIVASGGSTQTDSVAAAIMTVFNTKSSTLMSSTLTSAASTTPSTTTKVSASASSAIPSGATTTALLGESGAQGSVRLHGAAVALMLLLFAGTWAL